MTHEKMIEGLIAQGLIDEAHNVTPAGNEYTRALIAELSAYAANADWRAAYDEWLVTQGEEHGEENDG